MRSQKNGYLDWDTFHNNMDTIEKRNVSVSIFTLLVFSYQDSITIAIGVYQ